MTAEERITQLEKELAEERAKTARLQAENEQLHSSMEHLQRRLQEVEARLAKDSHNSSKPPSSDGPGRKPRAHRKKSEKPSGGQPGHIGRTLMQVASPDTIVSHRPEVCTSCQSDLRQTSGIVRERRQVHDLPELRLIVQEHQVEEVRCPTCQHMNRACFPAEVDAPACYGPRVQALAVYLSQFQLLPMERTCEALEDLYGCSIAEGTLMNWTLEAAQRLEPTMERIKALLASGRFKHADETGMRIKGRLHWTHVSCTPWLTCYAWHRKRGKEALESIGIWPNFRGRAMRDRWASYDQYDCDHSLCGAHLVRDCTSVAEQDQQKWAADMLEVLLGMAKAAQAWRERGDRAVPVDERDVWVAQYFEVLAAGFAAQAPPRHENPPKHKGRRKQSAAKNLLDALLQRAEMVLAFLDDLSLPFTNNLAERDLRMIKVQQKISGSFRSEAGATAFCTLRSYLSTMRKQGRSMLAAMAAVFAGSPFPVAWGT